MKMLLPLLFLPLYLISEPCCCVRWNIKTLADIEAHTINYTAIITDFTALERIDSVRMTNTVCCY